MILDELTNWRCYSRGNEQVWNDALDFIQSIDSDAEEKRYTIRGDSMFAFVQRYDTIPLDEGKIEVHRAYVDVHSIITGREFVYYSSIGSLTLLEDFTSKSDDLLYSFKPEVATGFELYPGRFALFFPGEGHMTRVQIADSAARIKKVVLKISSDLLFKL